MPGVATDLEAKHKPKHRFDKARLLRLEDLDQRRRSVVRVRQVEAEIASDLGGAEALTETQRQLTRRTAVLSAVLEHEEALWAAGEDMDLGQYCNAASTLKRLCQVLGLQRAARDVTLLGEAD
jgi:hypothetical protein